LKRSNTKEKESFDKTVTLNKSSTTDTYSKSPQSRKPTQQNENKTPEKDSKNNNNEEQSPKSSGISNIDNLKCKNCGTIAKNSTARFCLKCGRPMRPMSVKKQ